MDNFLQSKSWEKFQQSLGRKTFWVENSLIIKHILPLGKSFLYAPRAKISNIKAFLREAKTIARKENSIFLRLEPLSSVSDLPLTAYRLPLTPNIQPADTLVLDLTQSENKILENMHSKTRYNIRLAQKHKVKIEKSSDPKDIDIFWKLAQITGNRDGFRYHPKNYYQKMLEILGPDNLKLYTAYIHKSHSERSEESRDPSTNNYRSQDDMIPVASALIWFYKKTAIYLHGASDHKYRKFMAPYLIQWQAIMDAKKNGCKFYDFWGIAPSTGEIRNPKHEIRNNEQIKNEKNNRTIEQLSNSIPHEWAGITRFKTGFSPNGKFIHYPPCTEIIYQKFWYFLYKLLRK